MKRLVILVCLLLPAAAFSQEIKEPGEPRLQYLNIAEFDRGFWFSVDAEYGGTLMQLQQNTSMLGLNATMGYRFSQFLKIGAGLGALYYMNNDNIRKDKRRFVLPLYANLRGNFLNDDIYHVTPYWSVNVGAVVGDGFFASPMVGVRLGEKRSAFILAVGYSFRMLNALPELTDKYHGMFVKLGYEF